MRVGELKQATGASLRALRYYEAVGLVVPKRLPNGYRDYEPVAVRQVEQIQALTSFGLSVEQTRPFVECLALGHEEPDDCVTSLAAYRSAITDLTARIESLTRCRDVLSGHLEAAAERMMPGWAAAQPAPSDEPVFMPVPLDHLTGLPLPAIALQATDGSALHLNAMPERALLFIYPLTGRPGVDMLEGWESIPGAMGCTAEACGFRDLYHEILEAGAGAVYGVSAQSSDYQQELSTRLHLPFPMLSDSRLELAAYLGLPTFEAGGHRLYGRATLLVEGGLIRHTWAPIPDPGAHAADIVAWLRAQ